MASLLKEYSKEKLTGQIWTPFYIVDKILDDIKYDGSDVLGKTILDPACGDGRFLIKIAQRIIKYSKLCDLQHNLNNIYGWDIDKKAIKIARQKLDKIIQPYDICVNWNLKICNSLQQINGQIDLFSDKKQIQKFDFIVGNPPYIRIQHLNESTRQYIKKNYSFCKMGSTDIYIAFYELALNLLKNDGVCGYISPNSFFYTDTAKYLREYFQDHKNLLQVSNYGTIQLFENAITYSAIVIFNKQQQNNFLYQLAENNTDFKQRYIDFKELTQYSFWQLATKKLKIKKGIKLKDIADIHVGLTTLADKIYMMPLYKKEGDYIYLKSKYNGVIQIEKSICKPIIKASRIKSSDEPIKEFVVFPYKKTTDGNRIIKEQELKQKYPLAYAYLSSNKDILLKRDNGKKNKVVWYAFGRSQGLLTSFGEKILLSPMNKKPNFIYHKNKNACFYSGYCIKYKGDNDKLLQQLNSTRMAEYIQSSSSDLSSGWKAYNKRVLQEFVIV
ncbi:MAG: N-6 DNA methylase [Gammaproteobacteria bacterium]|nr:MAG: N-6 DNA methylase [Gammaproteobacteria bacterium]